MILYSKMYGLLLPWAAGPFLLQIIIHEKPYRERTNSSMIQPRQKWGWAMYDWANSAFATVVMAGFFPVFFKDYWNAGLDPVDSTFRLGVANSLASLLIVLLAPLLGAVADRLARRKAMLLAFALLGSLMTAGLNLVGQGEWQLAMFFYVFAMIGFSGPAQMNIRHTSPSVKKTLASGIPHPPNDPRNPVKLKRLSQWHRLKWRKSAARCASQR